MLQQDPNHYRMQAEEARPINEDDWATERQIAAENRFFDEIARAGVDVDELDDYKATTDELIDHGLDAVLGLLDRAVAHERIAAFAVKHGFRD